MVVTILTMVLCPLYIPSIWGLFSKRLSGNRLVIAMLASWVLGFTAKFTVPASVLSPSLIESISGFLVPVLILSVMELWCRAKGIYSEGYEAIQAYTDPASETAPGPEVKEATRKYSHLAINCFCITIGAIALLLSGMLIAGDPKTMASKSTVLGFIAAIVCIISIYVIYRIISNKRK